MSMHHEPIEDLLALYVTGDLEPAQRERVEAWLAASPGNREELARVEAVIRSVGEAAFDAPGDVHAEIDAGALLELAHGRRRRLRLRAWSLSAAAVLLAFFAGMWVRGDLLPPATAPDVPSARAAPSPRAREAWRAAQRASSGFASSLAALQSLSRSDG